MVLYCDGAATMKKINNEYVRENGGWAFAQIEHNTVVYSRAEGLENTTNNECELMAIYKALCYAYNKYNNGKINGAAASDDFVEIYSDSAYCVNIFTQWIDRWKKNGWTRGKGEPIQNLDLIKLIDEKIGRFKEVKFYKVKGHSTSSFNNYVDCLAVAAKKDLYKSGRKVSKEVEEC